MRAQLGDPDLEGDPRPRRGLLEDQRDAAPGQRIARRPGRRGRLSARAPRSSSLPSSKAPSSSPVRKSRFKRGILRAWSSPPSPGTSSTAGTSRPTRELLTWRSRLLRIDERNETHVQVNRDLTAEFATLLAGCRLGRRPAAGVPAALRGAAGAGLRRRGAPGADLAQLARRRCGRCSPRHNPDLIASGEGGSNLTLVRVPRPPRADRRAPRAGDPRGHARAPGDGLHPDRLRRLRRQPARDQRRADAGGRGRPARRAAPRRVAGGRAADLRRRPQPAPGRGPRRLRAAARGVRPRAAPTGPDGRSTTCSSAGWRCSRLAHQWPPERREVPLDGRALRLSDHAPVQARFAAAEPRLRVT